MSGGTKKFKFSLWMQEFARILLAKTVYSASRSTSQSQDLPKALDKKDKRLYNIKSCLGTPYGRYKPSSGP